MKTFIITALLLAFFPTIAAAAEPTEAVTDLTLTEILKKGGWVMYALVALSIFTLILVLLYFLTIRRSAIVTNRL